MFEEDDKLWVLGAEIVVRSWSESPKMRRLMDVIGQLKK